MEDQKTPDLVLFFVVVTLLVIGLIMILSASSIRSLKLYGDSYYLFKHQLIWAIIGIIAMIFFMNVDYHIYLKYGKLIILITIIGLFLVLIPGVGRVAGGARRWIDLGPIGIQPSELAKLAIIIYFAQYVTTKPDRISSFKRGIVPPLIILGLVFGLILKEPDLGTAVTVAGIFFVMLFASGSRLSHLFLLITASIPLIIFFILSEDYRRKRLFAFFRSLG